MSPIVKMAVPIGKLRFSVSLLGDRRAGDWELARAGEDSQKKHRAALPAAFNWSRSLLFAHTFDKPRLLSGIRRFRSNPIRVYAVAIGIVLAATLVRLALHTELSTSAPFTTYSLGVLCMALGGGFWPGMLTLVLSVVTGSILFLPPAFSFTLANGAEWTLLMFAFFGTLNVILVSGLIA